jgi:serine protease DegQ
MRLVWRPALLCLLTPLLMPASPHAQQLDPERGVLTLAPLLERITPAVVNVSVQSEVPAENNPLFTDPFFRRFFDLPAQPRSRRAISAGSGLIVDARRGYVLTNHHVVRGAEQVTVTLKDRREFTAQIVGSDPATDVAVLKIPAERLSAIGFGDSDDLKVGDLVVAIGNPFGLGQTVTSGIVSALGRSGITSGKYEDFIQTDASINPGNSGGALINSKGELIGINTAILAPNGGNVGIGFAVPANMARTVMDQLLRFGEVHRGRIGVVIQDLAPDAAASMGLTADQGAVIARVEQRSPADRAGLREGDVVLAVDGAAVHGSTELRNRIALVEADHNVALDLLRDGRRLQLTVKVAAAADAGDQTGGGPAQLGGASLSEIPPNHPAYGQVDGVLVTGVARGSPAANGGLRRGDIIVALDGQAVGSVEEVSAFQPQGRRLTVQLLRGDRELRLVMG